MAGEGRRVLLSAIGITKVYPGGIVANNDVSIDVYEGEVLGLLGENGAGKTTLVSIIAGYQKPDRGYLVYKGRSVVFSSPKEAMANGIILVPQHPKLIEAFTVAENIALAYRTVYGRAPRLSEIKKLVIRLSEEFELNVNPDTIVRNLTMGERQRAEIVKALVLNAKLLLLDEPTTHLSPVETERLIVLVRQLAKEGRSIVVITHRIKEVLAMADRIAVMRKGRLVGIVERDRAGPDILLKLMFGGKKLRASKAGRKRAIRDTGSCILRVEQLRVSSTESRGLVIKGVSFCVRGGEIVGIAGIAGNGQRELFEALIGIRRAEGGKIYLSGADVTNSPPSVRSRLGLAIIPEERLGWALVKGRSLVFNVALGFYSVPGGPYRGLFVDWRRAEEITASIVKEFSVRTAAVHALVDSLSGGNMQKFIVGREVAKRPRVLLAMNPTAGLDVDAAEYVRNTIVDLAERGVGILLISEDLDELLEVSSRILVMYNGLIVLEDKPPYNVDAIAKAMVGESFEIKARA